MEYLRYLATYNGKKLVVKARSEYQAQYDAARYFRVRKQEDIHVELYSVQ